MGKEKMENWRVICLCACFFILGINTMQILEKDIVDSSFVENNINNNIINNISVANSEKEIVERCSNLSLNKTAECLVGEINRFYFYKEVRGDVAIGLERMKNFGGDCSSYSFLYERLGKELGFETATRKYDWEKDIFAGHRMAFIWDDETYCRLDLNKYYCSERLDYGYNK